MKTSRRVLMWLVMLNKRLYKKPGFIVILVLVPILTAVMAVTSSDDSGILNIALYKQDAGDLISSRITNRLMNEDSIVNYALYTSEEEAMSAVRNGKADALWIFPADMQGRINGFVKRNTPIIRMVEREDNVFMKLARETLYSKLFRYISPALYKNYMYGKLGDDADERKLDRFYEDAFVMDNLVDVSFSNSEQNPSEVNYLTGPIRGIAAGMILLCALAAVIYFKQDKARGLFALMPSALHPAVELASVFIAALNAAVMALLSLLIAGLFTVPWAEIAFMVLYVLMCSVFGVFIGELFGSVSMIGALLPVITLLTLVLCPVFINVRGFGFIQMLLPAYHYLNAFSRPASLLYSLLYIAIGAAACIGLIRLKN